MENQITVINPEKKFGLWVFTDPRTGLVDEPFVSGADVLLDVMTWHIPGAAEGFNLLFSAGRFPDADHEFVRQHEDDKGWWYWHKQSGLSGWLCPALFKYFDEAPERIFVKCKPKEQNNADRT